MRVHLGGKDHGAATSACDGNGHQPNGSCASDKHIERRDFSREHGMDGVTEWIEYRGIVFRNRGIDFPDIAYGDYHEFSEAPVRIDSDYFHILADMGLAHAAGAAMSTIDVHFRTDKITGTDRGYF